MATSLIGDVGRASTITHGDSTNIHKPQCDHRECDEQLTRVEAVDRPGYISTKQLMDVEEGPGEGLTPDPGNGMDQHAHAFSSRLASPSSIFRAWSLTQRQWRSPIRGWTPFFLLTPKSICPVFGSVDDGSFTLCDHLNQFQLSTTRSSSTVIANRQCPWRINEQITYLMIDFGDFSWY